MFKAKLAKKDLYKASLVGMRLQLPKLQELNQEI